MRRCDRQAITDMLEAADRSEAKLANEPTDSSDAAEPTLPMLSTDPTDPMLRNEFVEPIESIEWRDPMLHFDRCCVMATRPCCHGRRHDGVLMELTRADLLDLYDTTIVSTLHPTHGWTDPALVAIERRQGAVVVTAWNPGVVRPSEDENRRANEDLLGQLQAAGVEVWRADGRAPDGSFGEEGWIAWGLPMERGLELAAAFGQFAIFTYDDAGLRVTVALPG